MNAPLAAWMGLSLAFICVHYYQRVRLSLPISGSAASPLGGGGITGASKPRTKPAASPDAYKNLFAEHGVMCSF